MYLVSSMSVLPQGQSLLISSMNVSNFFVFLFMLHKFLLRTEQFEYYNVRTMEIRCFSLFRVCFCCWLWAVVVCLVTFLNYFCHLYFAIWSLTFLFLKPVVLSCLDRDSLNTRTIKKKKKKTIPSVCRLPLRTPSVFSYLQLCLTLYFCLCWA